MIKQGWQRATLFLVIYAGIYFLAGMLFAGSAPPAAVSASLIELYPFFLFSFFVSVILVIVFRIFIDRKSIASLGILPASYWEDGITGMAMAIAILGSGSLILHFRGYLTWVDISFKENGLMPGFILMVLVAGAEELVFRGYILGSLMDSFNRWSALAISAIIFALFHFQNSGMDIIPFINLFIGGLLLGINYIYTRNLWFSFLFHLGWNFIQGPVLGYPVSGISIQHFLVAEFHGNAMMTGGSFGFEGSLIAGLLSLAAFLLLAWAYKGKYPTAFEVSNDNQRQ